MVDYRIDVVVDPSGAVAGTRTVERELIRVENRADRMRASLGKFLGLLGGGAVLAGAVRTLADFDQALSTVAAVSGATAEQFVVLRDKALELGAATRFTATEAASALGELTRAGFSANEALAAVGDTLVLAQAGGLGLSQATDIAANTIRGFGLAADQAGRVADVLAAAANKSNQSVGELGQGLSFAAPIAASLGVSLEETAAAMGVLADAGIKATRGGTGLIQIFSSLLNPTKETLEVFRRLGLSAEDYNVKANGLVPVLQKLKDAGFSVGDAFVAFGDRGGPTFEVLAAGIPKAEALTQALLKAQGSARATADIMDDNLNGALLRAKSAFEALVLQIGGAGGTSGLRSIFEGLANALRFMAANADTLVRFAQNLALFLGPRYLLGAVKALGVAIAANPIGLLITVVAALAAAIPDLQAKITGLVQTIGELATSITAGLSFEDFFKGFASAIDGVVALFNGLLAAGGAVFDQLGEKPAVVGELMKDAFRKAVAASLNFFLAFAQTVGNVLIGVGKDILDVVSSSISAASRVISGDLENAQAYAELTTGAVSRAANRLTTFGGQFESNLKKIQDVNLFGDPPALSKEAADLGALVATEFNRAVAETTPTASEALDRLIGRPEELAAAAAERAKALTGNLQPAPVTPPAAQDATKLSARAQELLDQLDTVKALREEEAALNEVLGVRPDLIRSVEDAMLSAQIAALESSTALGDGFTRAFLKIKQEAQDFASVAEQAVNVFVNGATDALTNFVKTGELNFKKFAVSILEEITRIIIRLLVVQAISAALGVAGISQPNVPNIPADTGGGGKRAEGGTVQPDRSYVVGENGPEIFQPGKTGTIIPNSAPVEQKPANVQIVNIDDPSKIPASIESGDSDQAILNFMSRNKGAVNQILR